MGLSIEQKHALFDDLDRIVNGRSGTGKSRYFRALCQLMKDLGAELGRDPARVPPGWSRP